MQELGEIIMAGLKECVRCHTRYDEGGVRCPSCTYEYAEKIAGGVVAGIVVGSAVAAKVESVVKPEEPAHAKVEKKTRRGLFGG